MRKATSELSPERQASENDSWGVLPNVLKDLPAENLDNIIRDLDELEERWNNSLIFGGPLTKYYLDGRLDILVKCRVRSGEERYVIFRAKDRRRIRRRNFRESATNVFNKPRSFFSGGPYQNDCSVLIHNVQIVGQAKGRVPSLAWVQSMDSVADFLAGTLYFFNTTGWQTVVVGKNGESGTFVGRFAIKDDGLIDKVVEGGSKAVHTISDDQAPLDRNFGPKFLASSLRITITDKKIGACLVDGAGSIAEVIDVIYGPFDLGARSLESG